MRINCEGNCADCGVDCRVEYGGVDCGMDF